MKTTAERLAQASSTKTAVKTLQDLAEDNKREVRAAALINPKLSRELVEKRCRFHETPSVIAAVVRSREDLSEEFLAGLLLSPPLEVELAVLQHHRCPPQAKEGVLCQPRPQTEKCRALAQAKTLLDRDAVRLAQLREPSVLLRLAENAALTPKLCKIVAEVAQKHSEVLEALLDNPNVPQDTIEALRDSDLYSVEQKASQKLKGITR